MGFTLPSAGVTPAPTFLCHSEPLWRRIPDTPVRGVFETPTSARHFRTTSRKPAAHLASVSGTQRLARYGGLWIECIDHWRVRDSSPATAQNDMEKSVADAYEHYLVSIVVVV